jgi:hypothetical protein
LELLGPLLWGELLAGVLEARELAGVLLWGALLAGVEL